MIRSSVYFSCYFIFTLFSTCHSAYITIFEDAGFTGESLNFIIDYNNGCHDLPSSWEGKTSAMSTGGICVNLYSEWNCKGKRGIRLYPGNRSHENLTRWNFDDLLKSVQACEKHINDTNCNVEGNSVAVWEEKDYRGEYFNMNVDLCENLPEEWQMRVSATSTLGKCYKYYSELNCTGNFIEHNAISPGHNDFKSWGFDDKTVSIGICNPQSVVETSGSPSTIKTETAPSPPSTAQPQPNSAKTEKHKKGGLKTQTITLIVAGVIVIAVLILVIGVILYVFSKYRKREERILEREFPMQLLSSNYIEAFMKGNVEILSKISDGSADAAYIAQHMPYDTIKYEIPLECISMDFKHPLGMGEFGIVTRATVTSSRYPRPFEVAVKSVKPGAEAGYVKAILDELKIMMYLNKENQNPHIVNLVGALEPYIVLEFCKQGSLDKCLRKHRKTFLNLVEKSQIVLLHPDTPSYQNDQRISTIELFQWSKEIAEGMKFLSSKRVIHGDLATRNVLLDDHMRAKISDFGLSRQLYQYTQYVKKQQAPLPWRWMALESLDDMTFSCQSDVWAFGVTLWEIFSLAEMPYPGVMWSPQFLCNLKEGFRLSKPKNATSDIFNIMLTCWREHPEDRPMFAELLGELCTCMEEVSPTVYTDVL